MDTLDMAQFHVLRARPRLSGSRIGTIVAIEHGPVIDFPDNPLGPQKARMAASLSKEDMSVACGANLPVLLVFENDDPSRPVIVDIVIDCQSGEIPTGATITDHRSTESIARRADSGALDASLARIVGIESDAVLVETVAANPGPPLAARTTIPLRNLKDPVVLLYLPDGSAVIVGQVYPQVRLESGGGAGADVVLRGSRVTIEADVELVLTAGACRVRLDSRGKAETTADQIVSRAQGVNKVQGGSVRLN